MEEVDENFLYVTNSLRRIDIMYTIAALKIARNCEISDIICLSDQNVGTYTKQLADRGLLEVSKSKEYKNYKFYSLSDEGKRVVQKLRDYHGINGE